MKLDSLRFKGSVLALLVLTAILIVYSGLLFFSFRYSLYEEMDGKLQAKAQKVHNAVISYLDVLGYDRTSFEFAVNRVISQTGSHVHENKIEKLEKLWLGQATPLGINDDLIVFLSLDGKVMARSSNTIGTVLPVVSARDRRAALRGHSVLRDGTIDKKLIRSVLAPFTHEKLRQDRTFLIWMATSRQHVVHQLRQRLLAEAVGVSLILLVASLFTDAFIRRILRPVREITRTARNINYKDLGLRIQSKGADQEMRDLIDALNEMISRLERSFKFIAEFSSHVSHELKTPLAIMRGESELALRAERSPEEYRKSIRTNLEEIGRMTKITEDLLLIAKLDYQPEIFKLQPFDFSEFFQEVTESTRVLAADKGIEVTAEPLREAVRMQGDSVHLRRLFFNLINNAIKFTPSGGSIHLDASKSGRQVRVKVTDTGIGISAEHLPLIFDKFFHYDGMESNADQGNGLGLSIAHSIAKIHGGDIGVRSRLGRGSVFTVTLPVH